MASCQGYNSKIDDVKVCKDKALAPEREGPLLLELKCEARPPTAARWKPCYS